MYRGGGNGLKPSHNHGLHLFLRYLDAKMHRGKVCIKAARQLRSYAAKIFNYNHARGLKRHTEDNSPKYRMVGNLLRCLDARGKVCYDKSSLRVNAKQSSETVITRSE